MVPQKVKISEIKTNPKNPRLIKDDKFRKLVKSVKEFPQMLELRPIVVDENNIILGGNMRFKACKEAGLKDIYILRAENLTDEQKNEFIVKDNVGFGEWDWDILANEWDENQLEQWGLDLPIKKIDEEIYTTKVTSPIYEIKGEKPKILDLFNLDKYTDLVKSIEKSKIDNEIKEFLKIAAYRHIEFNYKSIAEFYAHADKDTQELMEDSALIIIDYNKAIEKGFVQLFKTINDLSDIDE